MSRYIDADALIDKLMNAIECGRRVDMPTQELEAVLSDVRNAPSIDIVPKRGEWIADIENQYHYRCSNCGILAESECKIWNFCPNCGADMRKESE